MDDAHRFALLVLRFVGGVKALEDADEEGRDHVERNGRVRRLRRTE